MRRQRRVRRSKSSASPLNIVAYISGHGYGHAAQIAPVLNSLAASVPKHELIIRSELPNAVLASRLACPFTLLAGAVDIGVVQHHAVSEDVVATCKAAHMFFGAFDMHVETEFERLRSFKPALILSDISPMAFPVARALGVPGVGIASLDWHDIYSAYLPPGDPVLGTLKEAHRQCDVLIKPPLSMPMATFPRHQAVEAIVATPATSTHNLPPRPGGKYTALVMFGGTGAPAFDVQALAGIGDWHFFLPGRGYGATPANVEYVELGHGLSTMDLMRVSDVVVTKPGYGTLAECWFMGRPIAYVPRPEFPEYPCLQSWLQACAPSVPLPWDDFQRGNWRPALQAARESAVRYPPILGNGAEQAAAIVMDLLR